MKKQKLTKEVVNSRLEDRGITLIGEFTKSHTSTLFRCADGHEWMARPSNVMFGTGCPHCSGNIPLTRAIVNERLAERGITMLDEYVTQKTKSRFICGAGHEWTAAPGNVLYGKGCPICMRVQAGLNRRLTRDQVVERLRGRGLTLVGEYTTSNEKTEFSCNFGHTWSATPASVMSGNGCPVCSNRVKLTIDDVNERIAGRGIKLVGEFETTATRTTFECQLGHTWISTAGGVLSGSGCPHCAGQAPLTKDIVNERLRDRGLVMIGDYTNVDTKTQFKCSLGHVWEAAPDKVMRKTGCPICSNQAPLTTAVVNERIEARGLKLVDEFVNNTTKVRFRCSENHVWTAKPNNVLNGRGCPHCATTESDNDVFYVWVAEGQSHVPLEKNQYLVKYGVSSERLGLTRINDVARSWGAVPEVLAIVKTIQPATWSEYAADDIGQTLEMSKSGLDGWTEFRIVTIEELRQIMEIADQSAASKIVWNPPKHGLNGPRMGQMSFDLI